MWEVIVLSFLGGAMGGNAFPHFVRGITRQRYPSALGNGPVPNLIAGWIGLLLSVLIMRWAHPQRHPGLSLAGAAIGILLIGLFHAGPGAFGRPEDHQPRDSNADSY